MAYSAANLTRIGGASNGDLWFYSSTDTIATVNTEGYFNDAANMLAVRDVIIVVDSNTPTTNLVMARLLLKLTATKWIEEAVLHLPPPHF